MVETCPDITRIIPETVSLLLKGVQSLVLPDEGVAQGRNSSMYFRNDEQIVMLQKLFNTQTKDPNFFRSVIFTCDTVQYGQESQNIETLNWYIDQHESDLIKQNMQPLDAEKQTGRDRNALRLAVLTSWWNARLTDCTALTQETPERESPVPLKFLARSHRRSWPCCPSSSPLRPAARPRHAERRARGVYVLIGRPGVDILDG